MIDPKAFAKRWAKKIAAAQKDLTEDIGGKTYARIRYGDDYPGAAMRCRDCGVAHGQVHVPNCCVERCAKCLGQAVGCPCADAVVH